ncbi:MAG TPA: hypothetical protein VFB21_16650 [Chthonomonadaceae bacterium]|nr:hypothetical protein [Chthonomonadaceae bacterium]
MDIHQLEQRSAAEWLYDLRDELRQHVYARATQAFAAGDAARDALTTREAVLARQKALRSDFLASLGGLPPMDTPLEARTVGVVEGQGFRIEKVVFQSRPRHYVTANLYLPENLSGPRGAVLFVCGHHGEAKHVGEYQSVCQVLVQAGLIVLAQDPVGQGERFSYYEPEIGDTTVRWGTLEHDYAGAQCWPLGDGIARYFLHDAMRGIDYLQSRPEVDGAKIGVTGNSGGGTQSSLIMLGDPRLAAAAPATFIMSRETYMQTSGAQDAEQIWPGFTARGYDHEDILLAMAPKPVRVLAVQSDFFPIEGTRRTVARCKRLWGLFDRSEDVDLVEDASTHAYTPKMAKAAAAFFAKHLLGANPSLEQVSVAPFEPKRLWCMASGQVRGDIKDAAFVFEANRERLQEAERERQSLPAAQRRERAIQWLRQRVERDRRPCELNPRLMDTVYMEGLSVRAALWWAQEGLHNHGFVFRDLRSGDKTLPVTLALWNNGTRDLRPHYAWIRRTCESGRAVLALDVSGSGPLFPRPFAGCSATEGFYGALHKLSTDLLWLDDDLVSLRTYDVLRALELVAQFPGLDASDIQVYAHGREGLYGRLAAALDSRIRKVEVAEGMPSFAEWLGSRYYDQYGIYAIILHGALRYFDLPEIEG